MYFGIDLGTSNSAIAGNDGCDLRVFKTTDGYDVLPSALMIDRRGAMFVGKRAYDQDAFSPENVAKRFKRLMGTRSPVSFKAAGRTMTPEEASAEILKTLLAQAQMAEGSLNVDGAIVTIPAAFNQMQSEATMRAAGLAGLERVGLLQEPIAAAMASIAERQQTNAALKDGQFLVYDLGGGTFDAAIVQSVGGTVTVVSHAGVNMLGGTDFDRVLVNSLVRPWLLETFDLPQDFQKDPVYARVLRIAAFYAEKAKIEVSAQPNSTIFADESQISAKDRAGRDIYLDIPLGRLQVEMLVVDQIDRSIEVSHTLIVDSGYDPSDIDRIVFVGGPTRMPIIRSRVPAQLGIAANLKVDPMTAVAIGGAIFAESREWKIGTSQPKRSRTVARTEGPVQIEYGYAERTADSRIRIRVRPGDEAVGKGYRLQVDNDVGWTSGQLPLDMTNSINDVPVERRGDNRFRVVVFDAQGNSIPEAETRFVIKRVDAAASGTPLTHTIAVKIVEGPVGAEQNVLSDLYEKGQPLPANGVKEFRAAKDLKLEDNAYLDFEVYQREPGVSDPQLCLHVGSFPIESSFLERGEVIRRGDSVYVHWTLDENGLLDCEIEIKGQAIARRFKTGKMFTIQRAKQNFEGPEGVMLAETTINTAKEELDEIRRTLGSRAADEVAELEKRIERQRADLSHSYDADTSRLIAEEGRAIRQEISKIKGRRENKGHVLRAEADSLVEIFNSGIRPTAGPSAAERFDQLARQARGSIDYGNMEDAKKSISQMQGILLDEVLKQPGFLVNMFFDLAKERALAGDKAQHDRLVEEGNAMIERDDVNGLRAVLGQMRQNRIPLDPKSSNSAAALAGLMKK